jgi:hypothetical protein
MQAIMESIFDVGYLVSVIILGSLIIRRAAGKNREGLIFGILTLILGCGDAFHLVPRIIALWTNGFETYAAALGIGKLVTSITMTIFYVLLYRVWQLHYAGQAAGAAPGAASAMSGSKGGSGILTPVICILAAIRIILCLFPQNEWLRPDAPLSWGIYRNIPFVILGLIIVIIFGVKAGTVKKQGSAADSFRFMWLAITMSFAFYIPVVLWADAYPLIGMLMLPKTCAYVWMVVMGYKYYR